MNKKLLIACFMCAVLASAMVSNVFVKASDNESTEIKELECIRPYTQILEKLNEEFGTSFQFPTNQVLAQTGRDKSEVVQDILSTAVEDYEQLIRKEYAGDYVDLSGQSDVELKASTITQKAYYSGSNYVSIDALVYYADGENRYSSISNYGYGYTSAPYYVPYRISSNLWDNDTKCSVTISCHKMLNSSVSYDGWLEHKISAVFSANGGNTTGKVLS